jgi:hypothetical protein
MRKTWIFVGILTGIMLACNLSAFGQVNANNRPDSTGREIYYNSSGRNHRREPALSAL